MMPISIETSFFNLFLYEAAKVGDWVGKGNAPEAGEVGASLFAHRLATHKKARQCRALSIT
jgi:hypothetical protein